MGNIYIVDSKIKQARKRKGLTLVQVAQKSSINKNKIGEIENFQRQPTMEDLQILASIYGVTVDDIMEQNPYLESRYSM